MCSHKCVLLTWNLFYFPWEIPSTHVFELDLHFFFKLGMDKMGLNDAEKKISLIENCLCFMERWDIDISMKSFCVGQNENVWIPLLLMEIFDGELCRLEYILFLLSFSHDNYIMVRYSSIKDYKFERKFQEMKILSCNINTI